MSSLTMQGNTKLVFDHMMTFTKSQNANDLAQKLEMLKSHINEFETSMISSLNIRAIIASLQTYSNTFGDYMMCTLLIKKGFVKKLCDFECTHSTNDCISPEYFNAIVCQSDVFQRFFESQTDSVKRHCMIFMTLDIIERASLETLKSIKSYLQYAHIKRVLWTFLNELSHIQMYNSTESPDVRRNDLVNKIELFLPFLDYYGQYIDIFETFLDLPKHTNRTSSNESGNVSLSKRRNRLQEYVEYVNVQKSNPRNYKTIVDYANKKLDLNNESDKRVVTAVNARLIDIIRFRTTVSTILDQLILHDLAKLVFDYTFVRQKNGNL